MEGWSNIRDDPSLPEVESVEQRSATSYNLDIPIDECRFQTSKERLRALFHQVLVAFFRDKSTNKCFRPIPAFCGNGQAVDLFKLFWVVRKIGGYDAVSRNNVWGFVAQECGLGFGVIPSVKLIYYKYLNELDQWLLHIFKDSVVQDGQSGVLPKLDSWSRELETRLRGSLSDRQEEQQKVGNNFLLEYFKNVKHINPDVSNCDNVFLQLVQWVTGKIAYEMHECSGRNDDCDNGKFCIDNDFATSAKRVAENADNEVRGFSNRQINNGNGKSCVINNDNEVISGKKISNKLHNSVDKIVDDEHKRFPAEENSHGISAEKVVEKVISKVHNVLENFSDEEGNYNAQNGNDVEISPRNILGTQIVSRKRKHESQSLARMLKWLIYAAKHSDDPAIGKIPECSKSKDHVHKEFWIQALLVRNSLLMQRHANRNGDEYPWQDQQKKLRMHPLVYEHNVPNHQTTEKLRCCKQQPSLTISHPYLHCNSSEAAASNFVIHQKANIEAGPIEQTAVTKNSEDLSEKQVFVGPLFQAEIPEWTGVLSESDSKWLGTHIWPPEDGKNKSRDESNPIGKGRQLSCNCQFPDSVECTRFHIAEKRLKLKCELGLSFYHWQFNRMGEEVSLSWTKEEENRFKDAMRSHAAFRKRFWNNACRILPSKTREQLVSYYFNVFLIQRRSYQNRVYPNDIDSDDDEKECGSIGDSFGYKAINIACSRTISCTQNEKCTHLA